MVSAAIWDTIEIEKFSDRFDGTYVVSGVRQRFDERGWKTRVCRQSWHRRPESALLNSGAAVDGLRVGIVQI